MARYYYTYCKDTNISVVSVDENENENENAQETKLEVKWLWERELNRTKNDPEMDLKLRNMKLNRKFTKKTKRKPKNLKIYPINCPVLSYSVKDGRSAVYGRRKDMWKG